MSNSHIENFVNAVINKISIIVEIHNTSSSAHSSLFDDMILFGRENDEEW